MANKINISEEINKQKLNDILRKSFQSANINFFIGSGCSWPAIKPVGDIEQKIQTLLNEKKKLEAEELMLDFLEPIAKSNNKLLKSDADSDTIITLNNYKTFLLQISHILTKRKSNIHPRQASIFTTNYDLFIKKAVEDFGSSLKLHDGFNRNPRLDNRFVFCAGEFFNTVYNKGHLYNYQVEIPSINLIKLHGSLSWGKSGKEIVFETCDYTQKIRSLFKEIIKARHSKDEKLLISLLKKCNNQFNVILPRKEKFRDTLLNQIYYDLLRIYANQLDKENTLLIAEGFSFEDDHILQITTRALKNVTLRLIIFCYEKENIENYERKFKHSNNVDIVYDEDNFLKFENFNKIIGDVLSQNASLAKKEFTEEMRSNAE